MWDRDLEELQTSVSNSTQTKHRLMRPMLTLLHFNLCLISFVISNAHLKWNTDNFISLYSWIVIELFSTNSWTRNAGLARFFSLFACHPIYGCARTPDRTPACASWALSPAPTVRWNAFHCSLPFFSMLLRLHEHPGGTAGTEYWNPKAVACVRVHEHVSG